MDNETEKRRVILLFVYVCYNAHWECCELIAKFMQIKHI